MRDEILTHLFDVKEAVLAIFQFVHGKRFEDYEQDELLRSGVGRKFEIIGEALNRIKKEDAAILDKIRDYRNMVSFRNILALGYDAIDDRIVWGIIEENLSNLLEDIERLSKH